MSEHTPYYEQCTIEKQGNSEVRITAEIPVSVVRAHRTKAMNALRKEFELDGFRKGHVPESMILEKIGEQGVLEEVADQVLGSAYAEIVEDNKLDVVGRPQVTVTKLAPENPIGFTITVAVYPEVSLPDYKKLAKDVRESVEDPEKVSVADGDVQKELERLHGMMTEGEKKSKEKDVEKEHKEVADTKDAVAEDAPLDDAFAQKMGDFKTLDELRAKIKEGMMIEKKQKAREKRRLAILDAILEKVDIALPNVFVEGELQQMYSEFSERVARAGMEMKEYLQHIQKTEEDIRKEWRTDAEKRAKVEVVLAEIAKKGEAIIFSDE
jgi:trigger factor